MPSTPSITLTSKATRCPPSPTSFLNSKTRTSSIGGDSEGNEQPCHRHWRVGLSVLDRRANGREAPEQALVLANSGGTSPEALATVMAVRMIGRDPVGPHLGYHCRRATDRPCLGSLIRLDHPREAGSQLGPTEVASEVYPLGHLTPVGVVETETRIEHGTGIEIEIEIEIDLRSEAVEPTLTPTSRATATVTLKEVEQTVHGGTSDGMARDERTEMIGIDIHVIDGIMADVTMSHLEGGAGVQSASGIGRGA